MKGNGITLDQSGPFLVRARGQLSLRHGATWSRLDVRTNLSSDRKERGVNGCWIGSPSGAVVRCSSDLHCSLLHIRRRRLR